MLEFFNCLTHTDAEFLFWYYNILTCDWKFGFLRQGVFEKSFPQLVTYILQKAFFKQHALAVAGLYPWFNTPCQLHRSPAHT